jgi:hypothetical protein
MPRPKKIQPEAEIIPEKKKAGRPSLYSKDIADQIVMRMIEGESMVDICRDKDMPSRATVYRWLDEDKEFEARCARAREALADYLVDKIEQLAAETTEDNHQSMKVKISTAQWRAMKIAPRIYGERRIQENTGPGGGPVQTETKVAFDASALTQEQRDVLRAALLAAKGKG